jgi:2-amino-4-hydroxy-6-hydroxymethyldihydropteridine diphosphokinase
MGSNLGDRWAALRTALAELANHPGIAIDPKADTAGVYETAPVGGPAGQGWYLNSAVRLRTELEPAALLAVLMEVEARLGRQRLEPSGPRVIDLDLLLYDDRAIDSPGLQLPHPRMAERLFVLTPLADLAPDLVHPTLCRTVADLCRDASAGNAAEACRRLSGTGWS